ncbi:hypothetical protein OAT16_01005 [Prolixibacteraceae bacterium]|nr:hypothetical protein [Prolixibacteraceae bacterium]
MKDDKHWNGLPVLILFLSLSVALRTRLEETVPSAYVEALQFLATKRAVIKR